MYSIGVAQQTRIFLYSFGLGFFLGVLYDMFRLIRLSLKSGRIALLVQDISYLVICAVLTFFFVLVFSDGKIRGYIFWGELLGFLVYYFSVGMVTAQLFRAIIKVVRRSLRAVAHLFLTPGRWFSRKIAGFSEKMYNLYKNESKKFQSKAKYTLQQRNFLLYNLRGEQKEKKRE